VAATAMLATATATRLLYGAATLVAVGLLVFATTAGVGGRTAGAAVRRTTLIGAIPVVIVGGMAARQSILSGLPFYPSHVATLHADWTLPRAVVDKESRFVAAFARSAFHDPDQVLSSWHWFKPWVGNHARTLNTIGPALFLAAALPAAVLLTRTASRR